MSITNLIKLVHPPASPQETGSKKDWQRIEKEIETKLPSDYKEFIDRYGSGQFAGFFVVYNPFSGTDTMNLLMQLRNITGEDYRRGHENDGERYPYSIFPEPGGLFPWGGDQNGNNYFWRTEGEPDEWTVVQDEVRGLGFQEHKCGLVNFLLGVLQGKIQPLAGNYPGSGDLSFHPITMNTEKTAGQPQAELAAQLAAAIIESNVAKMRELIDAGADVNARFPGGTTPLYFAAGRKSLEPSKLLIAAGADINAVTDDGETPVFNAVANFCLETLEFLLDKGANPDARRKNGDAPIFTAILAANPWAVEVLAKDKRVLQSKNKAGLTPLALAKKRKNKQVLAVLQKAGAKK